MNDSVDTLLHVSPAGLLVGLIVGVALASVTVYRSYRRYL